MQKKLIAMAVAGLVAAPVFAQSNVTIYGRVDYGFMSRGGDNGAVPSTDTRNEMQSGIQAGSRIGFRGAEDLGNGLKAIFQLEYGVRNDIAGTNFANRNAHVGLTGNFGTVVGGRLDGVRYGIYNKYDPFAGGNMGNFTQITPQVDRADNAIAYISPSFAGLTGTLAFSTNIAGNEGTNAGGIPGFSARDGNDGDLRLYTVMLAYENGPISANFDHEQVRTKGIGNNTLKTTVIAGAYDFGVVKVSALYDILKSDRNGALGDGVNEWDTRAWFVGVKAPVGSNVVLKANYGRVKDKEFDDADVRKWGIGADYLFSKRTNLYASYGNIRNDSNVAYEINPSANSQGAGYGTRGFDLGIAHKF